jgi:hypothetical protein
MNEIKEINVQLKVNTSTLAFQTWVVIFVAKALPDSEIFVAKK